MLQELFYYVKRGIDKIFSFLDKKCYAFFCWCKKMETKGWQMHNEGKEGLKQLWNQNKK